MKRKNVLNFYGLDFNLQLFAEGSENAEGGENGTEHSAEAENKGQEEEKKYSDKDLDKIINSRFARWQKDQEKAIQDAKDEAAKLAKMNADQKQQYEMEKLQKENEELKAAAVKVELGKTAANMLREHDIEATEEILSFVVGNDADQTKGNIDRFVKIVEAQVKKAELSRATGTTPRSFGNNGNSMSEIDRRIAKYQ